MDYEGDLLLRPLRTGLGSIAGEGRSGYVVSVKLHGSVTATRMSSHGGADGVTYRNFAGFACRPATVESCSKGWTCQHRMRFIVAVGVQRNERHAEVTSAKLESRRS